MNVLLMIQQVINLKENRNIVPAYATDVEIVNCAMRDFKNELNNLIKDNVVSEVTTVNGKAYKVNDIQVSDNLKKK